MNPRGGWGVGVEGRVWVGLGLVRVGVRVGMETWVTSSSKKNMMNPTYAKKGTRCERKGGVGVGLGVGLVRDEARAGVRVRDGIGKSEPRFLRGGTRR